MTHLRRRLVVALLSIAASVSAAAQSPSRSSTSPATSAVDKVLADAVGRGDIPGVVAIVTDRNGVIYHGAFGLADAASGRPLAADAIFRIASMTKPITSLAAMQLIEEGRVALDDPATKYLPEFANLKIFESFDAGTGAYRLRPAVKTVTVRHLLTHTSGLGYNFTSPIVRDFKPRDGEQYAVGPLLFEPGEQWLYGTNTDWIGRIVESLTGKDLETYFRERIFAPLGMADTSYNVPADRQNRLVAVHRRRADGSFGLDANQPAVSVTRFVGGGGLASTAADYARLLRMFLNGGTLGEARIVSPKSIALMGENHIGSVGVPAVKTAMPERSSDFSFVADGRDKWGLGFLIAADRREGKRSPGSLSWGGINNTYFWIDPQRGIAGIILMQLLPFADSKALTVYDAFERAANQLAR